MFIYYVQLGIDFKLTHNQQLLGLNISSRPSPITNFIQVLSDDYKFRPWVVYDLKKTKKQVVQTSQGGTNPRRWFKSYKVVQTRRSGKNQNSWLQTSRWYKQA